MKGNKGTRQRNFVGPVFYYLTGPICFWVAVNISLANHELTDIGTPLLAFALFFPILAFCARKLTKNRLRIWPDRKTQWFYAGLFLTVLAVIGLIFGFEKAVFKAARTNSPINFTLVLESVLFYVGSGSWIASIVGANIRLLMLSAKNPSTSITNLFRTR